MKSGLPWEITISDADCDIEAAAQLIHQCAAAGPVSGFHTGVVLGSGLGALGQRVADADGIVVPYTEVPGMPQTAVAGHAGRLVIGTGRYAGTLVLQGRVHYYEGHDLSAITFATRLFSRLGVQQLVVTNAAGGIRPDFRPGDLMVIDGHWSLLSLQQSANASLLRASHDCLWNPAMRAVAMRVPASLKVHQGTYAMMSGPCYETPAEVRMLAGLGVSAVGMSTVPEGLAAARSGMRVLGVSCITNVASGLSAEPLDHSEVSETAASIETEFTGWMLEVIERLKAGA